MKYLQMDAAISDCGLYRYWLARRLSMGERAVAFVGVNPSTADASKDDPTIRKCVGFAQRWGYDWIYMLNLCAFRSTDVKALKRAADPIGPENWEALASMMAKCDLVVAAWGRSQKLPNTTARTYAARQTFVEPVAADGGPSPASETVLLHPQRRADRLHLVRLHQSEL